MVRTEVSPPVRYAVWAMVALLGAGLLWLGVIRYQEERSAAAAAPLIIGGPLGPQGSSLPLRGEGQEGAASVPPTGKPEPAGDAPAPALAVHVAGAVARPGVYRLQDGARVEDALAAAGGALPDAAPDVLNLAARVGDGEKLYVPTAAEAEAGAAPSPAAWGAAQGAPAGSPWTGTADAGGGGGGPVRVSVNTATAAELDGIHGIGPAIARAIVEYRTQHGRFQRLEELEAVPGIGPRTLERLLPYLTL